MENRHFWKRWTEEVGHDVLVFKEDNSSEIRKIGNIFPAPDWTFWFKHIPGQFDQPEAGDAWKIPDPLRVYSYDKSYMWFTFHRGHLCGISQLVQAAIGAEYSFTCAAQVWSNHLIEEYEKCYEDPRCSVGVGKEHYYNLLEDTPPLSGDPWNDGIRNIVLRVGIDPYGGLNPFSDTVVWGPRAVSYNAYHMLPEARAVAKSEVITVFIKSQARWAFRHNNVYVDGARLTITKQPVTDPVLKCDVRARVKYARTFMLPPPYATADMKARIQYRSSRRGYTVGDSADDAANGCGLEYRRVGVIDREGWPNPIHDFFEEYYWRELDEENPTILNDIAPALPWMPYKPASPYNIYQIEGRVLAFDLRDIGVLLRYPIHSPGERVPYITSEFGVDRGTYMHDGVDFRGAYPGFDEEAIAAWPGEVIKAGLYDNESFFGYQVVVRGITSDGRTVEFRYAHMLGGLYVNVGQQVQTGEKLGQLDSTGNSTGHHLHFSVKCDGFKADPAMLIDWGEWENPKPPSSWPYVVAKRGTKASFHAEKPDGVPGYVERLVHADAPPFTVKGVSDIGWLYYDVELPFANLVNTVARMQHDNEGCGLLHGDTTPEEMAAILMEPIVDAIGHDSNLREINFFEVANEPGGGGVSVEFHVKLAETMKHCSFIADAMGIKIAAFSFNCGCPEWVDMVAMAETGVFGILYAGGHIVATHEGVLGSDLSVDFGYGVQLEGAPYVEGSGIFCFRYKYLVAACELAESACPPILISEFYPGPRSGGNAAEVVLRTAWYDKLARLDYMNWGTQLFTAGPYASMEWSNMEYCIPAQETYAIEMKNEQNATPNGEPPPIPELSELIVGIHDEAGGEWLNRQADVKKSCCLIAQIAETQPVNLDFRHLQDAGSEVIVRLNYGWGAPHGNGTIAPPHLIDAHYNAIIGTIRNAKGVDYWQLWNEVNNPREWPQGFEVTSGYVVTAYNHIYDILRPEGHKFTSPGAVDPKYGPGSNNAVWQQALFGEVSGFEVVLVHAGKSQTNDSTDIWSMDKFSDDPLKWQYLHSRDVMTSLQMIPLQYKNLPVILGEVNPQFLTEIGGALGWVPGNSLWIHELCDFVRSLNEDREQPVTHLVFYRWEADQWALHNDQAILEAISKEAALF